MLRIIGIYQVNQVKCNSFNLMGFPKGTTTTKKRPKDLDNVQQYWSLLRQHQGSRKEKTEKIVS